MDFAKELDEILDNDPLGLLEIRSRSARVGPDERLVASFQEINTFVKKHGREPTASQDVGERRLYSRLKGLRESPVKAAALAHEDEHELLTDVPRPEDIETIDDILEHDVFGLLDDNSADEPDPNEIFELKNVRQPQKMPDHVAKRKPCKEFEKFEPLFKQYQSDLASGKKVLRRFTSELQITPGEAFILQGMMVYVANVGSKQKKNFGNVNARLYCVFDNGTESNMLLRSLAAALWKDGQSRQVIEAVQSDGFQTSENTDPNDQPTGYIYVLRSLSKDPQICEIDNLYKVGFSSQPALERIENASKEPTYLMADVNLVAEFQTFNLNPQKFELLLHTFFAEACVSLDVYDDQGKRHSPREWFQVPLPVIEAAVHLLVSGEIVNYRYNRQEQEINPK